MKKLTAVELKYVTYVFGVAVFGIVVCFGMFLRGYFLEKSNRVTSFSFSERSLPAIQGE